jgi:predicted O-linked N-acetylglucosamine transferase (SPINDLY family)
MNHAWAKVLHDAAGKKPRAGNDVADLMARAVACQQGGRVAEAQALYRQLLGKRSDHVDALNNLALCEQQSGHLEDAARLIRRAIELDRRSVVAHNNLAVVLLQMGRPEDALASCDAALALKPDSDGHYNRGNVLLQLGRFADALAAFDAAIALSRRHAEAFNGRGIALVELKRPVEAIVSYDKALALRPDYAEALNNRGCALERRRRMDEAIADFDRAITLAPTYVDAWLNRGQVLCMVQRFDDALVSFDRALSIDLQLPTAWVGLSRAFLGLDRLAEAVAACQKALEIRPGDSKAMTQLGQCLGRLGETESAVACFEHALAHEAGNEVALSNRIFYADFAGNSDTARQQQVRADWWRQIGEPIFARSAVRHDNDRDPNRRLVLGYVSGDFHLSSPAAAVRPVLQNHDKREFEVICYSAGQRDDDVTATFRAAADRWRNVSQWSDDQVAECIRHDKVDILIDLSGHTVGNRLHVFARKPAPIQVHAWGFATGTGLRSIDYLFSDPVALPAEVRRLFAEQIWDLPCATMMEPPPATLRSGHPPVRSNGALTYGVFNKVSKISDAAIALWGRIFQSNPTARLVVKDTTLSQPGVGDVLLERFAACGIVRDRIKLLGSTSRDDHLAAYAEVDVCLDPFPQGGGISTWEALYMGVPVVSKLGATVPSRIAGAIQSAIGLSEFVATNDDGYVEIALGVATDRLCALRRDLPGMIDRTCGPAVYTRAVDTAYRAMWKKYCG